MIWPDHTPRWGRQQRCSQAGLRVKLGKFHKEIGLQATAPDVPQAAKLRGIAPAISDYSGPMIAVGDTAERWSRHPMNG